jgi:uncharacterized protein YbbC (DUF1343 family)
VGRVFFGIDQILATPERLAGRRVGLVTNDAARAARAPLLHSRVALQQSGCRLVRIFSPEHGIGADAPDGASVSDALDPLTGLPVVSLYGGQLRPERRQLADLDCVLFDIPDIGARFYTYAWTLWHLLEACSESGTPLIVTDRPNPLGGDLNAVEGPMLDVENCASFLGRAAIPIRHSLTLGELARLWANEWKSTVSLDVIRCSGWERSMHWPDTGLLFVRTSPAMPEYLSALFYPGTCLFEATNLSAGRGTEFPFRAIGAPWLRAPEIAEAFNARLLPGVVAEPGAFVPASGIHAAVSCHAVLLRAVAPREIRPVAVGLHLLASVISLHAEQFCWTQYPTAANPSGQNHFERLIGRRGIGESLGQNLTDIDARVAAWTSAPGWRERVGGSLLYD